MIFSTSTQCPHWLWAHPASIQWRQGQVRSKDSPVKTQLIRDLLTTQQNITNKSHAIQCLNEGPAHSTAKGQHCVRSQCGALQSHSEPRQLSRRSEQAACWNCALVFSTCTQCPHWLWAHPGSIQWKEGVPSLGVERLGHES